MKHQLNSVKRRALLYQTVQSELKAFIIQNSLKGGDPMPPEGDLAQQLGIGRNSVREAIKSLETLGIVESRPGAGLFVSKFTMDPVLEHLGFGLSLELESLRQLEELLEVRSHIELGLIKTAAKNATPQQIARLRELLEEMREVGEKGGYPASQDREFHQVLHSSAGNEVACRVIDVFWEAFNQIRLKFGIPDPTLPTESYYNHKAIVDAFEAADIKPLKKALQRHTIGTVERIRLAQEQFVMAEQQEINA